MDGDYMLPAPQLPSNGTNLLILLGWVLLILWVYRIVRKFYLLYRLNVAIASGQVCATPHPRPHALAAHSHAHARVCAWELLLQLLGRAGSGGSCTARGDPL